MYNMSNNFTERELPEFINDTIELLKKKQIAELSSAASSVAIVNALTNEVEFWQWLARNYPNDFGSAEQIAASMAKIQGGMRNTFQGKLYEWDWMKKQRNQIKNIFSKFSAGDNPTQPGIDITKTNIITGQTENFQNKAYTSDGALILENTTKDTTIITNAEKVANAKKQGYSVEKFKTAKQITKDTDKKLKSLASGKTNLAYNLKNVATTSLKAGALGFVIGAGIETFASYRRWKNGEISDETYMREILLSGGNSGVTSAATSCIMIPVSAAITAAGVSSLVTFPIAVVVGAVVKKIISPAFRRGDYAKILSQAKYYEDLSGAYKEFMSCAEDAAVSYEKFIYEIARQRYIYDKLREADSIVRQNSEEQYEKNRQANISVKNELAELYKRI